MTYWRFLSWLTAASVTLVSPVVIGDVVFEEGFNDQPDWTSTKHSLEGDQSIVRGYVVPDNWWGIFQGTGWSPETGYPDKHASLEILSSNADKARGGTGKSAVFWRESRSYGNSYSWASDAQFVKVLDNDHPEVYVEFYIRFSENWWQRNKSVAEITGAGTDFTSKIFRMGHWTRDRYMWNQQSGEIGPRLIWQYKIDAYGLRSQFLQESGPPAVSRGVADLSRNYTSHTKGQEIGGTDPQLFDQDPYGAGELVADFTDLVLHENVFGQSDHWTKVAFYAKLNSAPGVSDGIHYHWINDHRVMARTDVPWIASNAGNEMPGWNYFAIGGNDFFRAFPDENRFEDWYSIDDVVVQNAIPERLLLGELLAPNPPSSLTVQ
jgi:hypothetical protein